jgi:hypothetical protein
MTGTLGGATRQEIRHQVPFFLSIYVVIIIAVPKRGEERLPFLDEGAAAVASEQEAAALRGWYGERARKTGGAAAWW